MTDDGFFNSHGAQLYERHWLPASPPRAHVVFIHGYGDYCERHAPLAAALNREGLAVHTYDQRGCGRSPGRRGQVPDFSLLVQDLAGYLAHIRPRVRDSALFLLGHSMGGLVLATHAAAAPLATQGLIFSSPFLAFSEDLSPALIAVGRVLGVVAPWLPVVRTDCSGVSRDPEVVQAVSNDPGVYHGWIRAGTGAQFNAAIRRVRARFAAITQPLYIMHGSADEIVSSEGSRMLYDSCGSSDKCLRIHDGGYHELWNDLDRETVVAEMMDWIAARI
ncbi:MAG: lysophospholipase [Candidatus Hydrogenedentes bacterium]|nr:lysophospholipase [Candidatus Hydrogenedentota bacterium]